jgi:ABC-type uncharacterized transport system ATPase subunit
MKFEFKNIGLIDNTEIELADLTILCGENNTGKTYATYSIYGFYTLWRPLLRGEIKSTVEEALKKSKNSQIDLNAIFLGKINSYLEKISSKYAMEYLFRVFASSENFFDGSKFTASLSEEPKKINFEKPYFKSILGAKKESVATINKKENSSILEILVTDGSEQDLDLTFQISEAVQKIIFEPYFRDTFIASAERTGATIFSKDLNFNQARAIEALTKQKKNNNKESGYLPLLIMREMFENRYPMPVEDNVEFIRELEATSKRTSEVAKESPQILSSFEKIVGGKYKVVKNYGVCFYPRGVAGKKFSMTESSSAIRALLDLNFYLNCSAEKGDLLMIDEPELNLHPANQRAFGRLIARLINYGIKVFVTTHSDYIIKELNTLIMLNEKTNHTKNIQKNYGYEDEELLDFRKVKLFTTTANPKSKTSTKHSKTYGLKESLITKDTGIEVETFDKNIDQMNEIQNEILFGDIL